MSKGNVIEHIPFGHRNAVSRKELCRRAGLSDRALRQHLKAESTAEHPIINMQDGAGYFRPTSEEVSLIRLYRNQEYNRATKILKQVRALDKFYEKMTGSTMKAKNQKTPSELEKSQISIFDYEGDLSKFNYSGGV